MSAAWRTAESDDLIREWWIDRDISTSEMGRRLGVSKNAIVGLAHRLGLASRPSPIIKRGSASPYPGAIVASCVTRWGRKPPLASVEAIPVPPRPIIAPAAPTLRSVPTQPTAGAPKLYGRVIACRWPIGEPATPNFHFCDANSVPGGSYCADHGQIAYVKVRDRREDAA